MVIPDFGSSHSLFLLLNNVFEEIPIIKVEVYDHSNLSSNCDLYFKIKHPSTFIMKTINGQYLVTITKDHDIIIH